MLVQSAEQVVAQAQHDIPLCVPHMTGNEWAYIKECLDTNFVSSVGPFVERFERAIAIYVGTDYAVATVNGTAALHVALHVAGVTAGDEVLVPTLTFIAPVNAIRYLGAWPVLVDVERDYWQMDVAAVDGFLRDRCVRRDDGLYNAVTGRRIAAIVPVHILGHPVDLDRLVALGREFSIPIVEDATESLGAHYRDRAVGTFGLLSCFSFNGNKLITTGGGGMICTNDPEAARRAKYLTTQAKDDAIEFIHGEVGYNYRLTNVLAALGVAQAEQLPVYVERKREIARRYAEGLAGIPGITPMREAGWARSVFWLYTVLVDAPAFGMDSRALLRALHADGIQTRPLWQPMHQSPSQRDAVSLGGTIAEQLNRDALSVPCSIGLTEAQQERVIERIRHHAAA